MHPEPVSDRPSGAVSTSADRRMRLSRRQRALLGQWQAIGYLLAFIGLLLGIFLSWGISLPLLGGLMLAMVVLDPLLLTLVSTGAGHYRLASIFALLSVLLDAGLVLMLLITPFDGYPLPEQIARVLESVAAAGLVTAAAAATLDAARALWGASDGPRRLGPGTPAPTAGSLAAAEPAGPGEESSRRLPTTRLVSAR